MTQQIYIKFGNGKHSNSYRVKLCCKFCMAYTVMYVLGNATAFVTTDILLLMNTFDMWVCVSTLSPANSTAVPDTQCRTTPHKNMNMEQL